MNQNLGDLDVAEMPLHKDVASAAEASPTNVLELANAVSSTIELNQVVR